MLLSFSSLFSADIVFFISLPFPVSTLSVVLNAQEFSCLGLKYPKILMGFLLPKNILLDSAHTLVTFRIS